MRSKTQQLVAMRSDVTVLLVNAPYSHMHGFYIDGVSSGLATSVTLTRVSRGMLGESITRGLTCF
jgi:hypothetical protein